MFRVPRDSSSVLSPRAFIQDPVDSFFSYDLRFGFRVVEFV